MCDGHKEAVTIWQVSAIKTYPLLTLKLPRPSQARLTSLSYTPTGQFLHLHIRVLAVENLDPQALYAINLAKTQGYSNANIHFASNSPEPQTLTDTPEQEERQGDFEPGMGLPPVRLPVTACLREGEMRCGVGVECVVEGGGSGNGRGGSGKGGVMQVLWGLMVEVGFCNWVETGSGLLARASEVGW